MGAGGIGGADLRPITDPEFVATSADGNVWFTEPAINAAGRVTPPTVANQSVMLMLFVIPTANSRPQAIAPGPDGNIWFVEFDGNKIARITPAGATTEFPLPTGARSAHRVAIAVSRG